MENRRALIYAVVFGAMGFLFSVCHKQSFEQKLRKEYEDVQVLVAAKNIGQFNRIYENLVTSTTIPKKFVPAAYINPKQAENLLGRIAAIPIAQGDPVLTTALIPIERAELSRKVQKRMRGYAVAVDDVSGVGQGVRPGDFVDVIALFDFGDTGKKDLRVYTLIEAVEVLAVGGRTGEPMPVDDPQGGGQGGFGLVPQAPGAAPSGREKYANVVLHLAPINAARVAFAQEGGTVQLSLRNKDDERLEKPETLNTASALGLPERIIQQRRPVYREIRAGGG